MTVQISKTETTTPVGATYSEKEYEHFRVDSLRHNGVEVSVFDSRAAGVHRSIHMHRIVGVKMDSGPFGPIFEITHTDGTTTRLYTYVDA